MRSSWFTMDSKITNYLLICRNVFTKFIIKLEVGNIFIGRPDVEKNSYWLAITFGSYSIQEVQIIFAKMLIPYDLFLVMKFIFPINKTFFCINF